MSYKAKSRLKLILWGIAPWVFAIFAEFLPFQFFSGLTFLIFNDAFWGAISLIVTFICPMLVAFILEYFWAPYSSTFKVKDLCPLKAGALACLMPAAAAVACATVPAVAESDIMLFFVRVVDDFAPLMGLGIFPGLPQWLKYPGFVLALYILFVIGYTKLPMGRIYRAKNTAFIPVCLYTAFMTPGVGMIVDNGSLLIACRIAWITLLGYAIKVIFEEVRTPAFRKALIDAGFKLKSAEETIERRNSRFNTMGGVFKKIRIPLAIVLAVLMFFEVRAVYIRRQNDVTFISRADNVSVSWSGDGGEYDEDTAIDLPVKWTGDYKGSFHFYPTYADEDIDAEALGLYKVGEVTFYKGDDKLGAVEALALPDGADTGELDEDWGQCSDDTVIFRKGSRFIGIMSDSRNICVLIDHALRQ